MSEEEIIKNIKNRIVISIKAGAKYIAVTREEIQGLLDLYIKEKEKNKNSISKNKIKKDLETCQKVYKKEMKPYQRDYGLDVTYLSKKEKEQLVNKRNCLITQMKTYEMLLEE